MQKKFIEYMKNNGLSENTYNSYASDVKIFKKYYEDFSKIEYIDKRMIIYRVLNDIGLLSRFDNDKLKENVLKYSSDLVK